MKKTTCLIIIFLLIGLLCSCEARPHSANSDKYSIQICGYTDSIPGDDCEVEYKKWMGKSYYDSKADKNITIVVDGTTINATYLESRVQSPNCYATHMYIDNKNNIFSVSSYGKLTSFFWGNREIKGDTKLTEEEYVGIAKKFLSTIGDVTHYNVEVNINKVANTYDVKFTKFVNETETVDTATVSVNQDGSLYSYSSFMFGQISEDVKINFDMDTVGKLVETRLNEIYGNVAENYDEFKYENIEYTLTKTDEGKYALFCSAEIKGIQHQGEYNVVQNERIRFIIMEE